MTCTTKIFSMLGALGAASAIWAVTTESFPHALQSAWQAAFNRGNLAALQALYSEDAVLLPPGGEMAQGREAMQAIFKRAMQGGAKTEMRNLETLVQGDLAYRLGTFVTRAPGAPERRGKYLEIWRKSEGHWKMTRDMWNGSTPAASPSAEAETLKAAEEVIALTKAQWQAEIEGKSAPDYSARMGEEYSEFNTQLTARLDDPQSVARLAQARAQGGARILAAEMLQPRVQVYGDVAILTYQYAGIGQDKDGTTFNFPARSTRVYAKEAGQWKLVHSHFSPASVAAQ